MELKATEMIDDLERNQHESIQDFVKRVIEFLFSHSLLPKEELELLQTKEYSKKTFGIDFPLLEKDVNRIRIKGYCRYWVSLKFDGRYYCCSQWWKQNLEVYDSLILKWLKHIKETNETKYFPVKGSSSEKTGKGGQY
jgi:hypothetical protein